MAAPTPPVPLTVTPVPSAFLVIRFTTAEKAFEPYRTDPGPLMISMRSRISTGNDSSRSEMMPPSITSRVGRPLIMNRMWPPSVLVWSPRAATMLRSTKYCVDPVSPGTVCRTSFRVRPRKRLSSSRVTTDMMLGACDSLSLNRDAVVTLMSISFSRSMDARSADGPAAAAAVEAGSVEAGSAETGSAMPGRADTKNAAPVAPIREPSAGRIMPRRLPCAFSSCRSSIATSDCSPG